MTDNFMFVREEAMGIVSVGGGSVIDAAKAVCVTLKNGGKCNDHIAINRLQEPQIPHIVVPGTSGTGSEVTNVAAIKSKKAGRRVFLMDALTHAVEVLTSIMAQPICDGQALQAIRLIKENLPRVKDEWTIPAGAV